MATRWTVTCRTFTSEEITKIGGFYIPVGIELRDAELIAGVFAVVEEGHLIAS